MLDSPRLVVAPCVAGVSKLIGMCWSQYPVISVGHSLGWEVGVLTCGRGVREEDGSVLATVLRL